MAHRSALPGGGGGGVQRGQKTESGRSAECRPDVHCVEYCCTFRTPDSDARTQSLTRNCDAPSADGRPGPDPLPWISPKLHAPPRHADEGASRGWTMGRQGRVAVGYGDFSTQGGPTTAGDLARPSTAAGIFGAPSWVFDWRRGSTDPVHAGRGWGTQEGCIRCADEGTPWGSS